MTCRDLYGFLDEFLEDRLDDVTKENFERHLVQCRACRRYLASYETALRVARAAERLDDPAQTEAPEQLILAILAARSSGPLPPPAS